ncbi:MAG: hypothetical protein V3T86_10685 [Planctomycetota bacterium]
MGNNAGGSKKIELHRKCPSCGGRVPGGTNRCEECGESFLAARHRARAAAEDGGGSFGPERAGIRGGVMGGVLMIIIAAVWFYVGWQAGRIFFYPPILALIGLYAIIKGMSEGNYDGGRKR